MLFRSNRFHSSHLAHPHELVPGARSPHLPRLYHHGRGISLPRRQLILARPPPGSLEQVVNSLQISCRPPVKQPRSRPQRPPGSQPQFRLRRCCHALPGTLQTAKEPKHSLPQSTWFPSLGRDLSPAVQMETRLRAASCSGIFALCQRIGKAAERMDCNSVFSASESLLILRIFRTPACVTNIRIPFHSAHPE